ncbi:MULTISPECIES: DUF2218 domain-containing protein [unclassified Roseobacter]|uniref:DUF2218 domain-containing protein n=1 Tax=unclassified Roseobacter TaxID=196798 RepID=UPI0018A31961|nr:MULTISPECIES: DUF2218 domain-containing protein [unclassified Roseobacter]MDW3183797.1 DUF2218 domain-containing protein [Roseobacter sp.]
MPHLTGTFATPHATKYMIQLCKHWSHKGPAKWDDDTGSVTLPFGDVAFAASGDVLTVDVDIKDGTDAATVKQVVDSHLQRFAFREGFETMAWSDTE